MRARAQKGPVAVRCTRTPEGELRAPARKRGTCGMRQKKKAARGGRRPAAKAAQKKTAAGAASAGKAPPCAAAAGRRRMEGAGCRYGFWARAQALAAYMDEAEPGA